MDGRTYDERITAAREAVFGNNQLSTIGSALIRNAEFQDVVDNDDDPDDLVLSISQRGRDNVAELALYRHYGVMIEAIGARFGRHPAFGPDDGHQEGVLALLEMARNGAADFTRRAKRAITNRVATEASRLSRAVTGFSPDQVRTVKSALEQVNHDRDAARVIVTSHPDVNRRMKADTFDAIAALLLPTPQPAGDTAEEPADPAAWPEDATAAYVDELLHHKMVSAADHELLCRAYGLYGFEPHTDDALGLHYGVDRSVAGKHRRRALATLRTAAKAVAAA
ncbi:hypothetical protein [Saccharopolyspora taberi]|uniref:Sigma-70 family RNA polymerase sigma factor n=1 Tax=Saccharopolyspora taberi TaxID=60895 RepID=A0ABN3VKB9_9PSEU